MKLAALLLLLAACGGPGPTSTPPPDAVVITAAGEAFTTTAVKAPADSAFAIYFQITDSSQHNVRIWNGEATVAATEIFGGPSARVLEVPALNPGHYRLTCDIHPSMHGDLEAV